MRFSRQGKTIAIRTSVTQFKMGTPSQLSHFLATVCPTPEGMADNYGFEYYAKKAEELLKAPEFKKV